MEDLSEQITDINSPNSGQNINPDVAATSPPNKSRYGRTRKPKISEDFYNIDVIFENARETKKSPRPTTLKSSPISKNIKLQPAQIKPKLNSPATTVKSPKLKHFEHVTGDTIMTDLPASNVSSPELHVNTKTVRKFFKRESTMIQPSIETTSNVQTEVESALTDESVSLQAVDVTKVLKIISTKTSEPSQSISDQKGSFKPILKTYSNKRKNFQKMIGVESFGLPDTPIFPLEKDKAGAIINEPKRIKNLDVVAPSSQNDINIVDKKLLDTPWKIASMNTDFADTEILSESCCDDDKIETEIKSASEEITQGTSLQEIDENMNGDKIQPNRTKKVPPKKQTSENIKVEDSPGKIKILKNKTPKKETAKESAQEKESKTEKVRSPRKQKQIISEEPVIIIENIRKHLRQNLRNKSPNKQKQISSEKTTIIGVEDSKSSEIKNPVRDKSPKKEKIPSELTHETPRTQKTHEKQTIVEEPLLQSVEVSEKLNKSNSQKRKHSSLTKTPTNQQPEKKADANSVIITTPQRKSLRLQMETPENINKKKLNITLSPEHQRKIKIIDRTLEKSNKIDLLKKNKNQQAKTALSLDKKEENNDDNSNVSEEDDITDLKTKGKILKVELRQLPSINKLELLDSSDTNINSVARSTRARRSKIDTNEKLTEKIENSNDLNESSSENKKMTKEKELENDIVYIDDDLDEMNLLDRSKLSISGSSEKASMESELLLEIKKEMDIEQENNGKTTEDNKELVEPCVSSTVSQEGSPNQQGKIKALESETSLYDLQIKSEPEDVELGDLMWAKIGGHPYWPCVVSADPLSNQYKSKRKHIRTYLTSYHVRFFGDRGRRSWVSSASVIRFGNKNDLNVIYDKLKLRTNNPTVLQPYMVKAHILLRWETAVSEAESLKFSTAQQRFDFFFNMFASEEEKALQQSIEEQMKNEKKTIDAEKNLELLEKTQIDCEKDLEASPVKVDGQKSNKTPKINVAGKQIKIGVLSQQSPTKKNFKPVKAEAKIKLEPPLSIKQTRSRSLPSSAFEPPSENPKENIKENIFETETLKPSKKGTSKNTKLELESNSRSSLPLQKDISKIQKESRENSIDEPPDTFLKNPWQVFDLAKRQLNTPLNEVNSECSFSDTDSHSKSSTNTPIPSTYKDQISRQRRNNLFRGIPRHRVCQVCKKPGEIIKCKGPCNGLFHSACSGMATKDSTPVIVKQEVSTESESTSDSNDTNSGEIQEDKKIENNLTNGVPDSNNLEKVVESISELPDTKKQIETIEEKIPKNNKSTAETSNGTNKVEIVHIDCDDSDFEHSLTPKVRLTPNTDFSSLSLAEQIDMKMKEIMQKFEKNTRYADSTTDYTSSEESSSNLLPPAPKPKIVQKKKALKIKHVTADCISFVENSSAEEFIGEGTSTDNNHVINSSSCSQGVSSTASSEIMEANTVQNSEGLIVSGKTEELHITGDAMVECETSGDVHSSKEFKCGYCVAEIEPPCSVCGKEVSRKQVSFRQKCSLHMCGKFYHPECLKMWPQTQWSIISTAKHKNSNKRLDTFVCPVHVCHTCASDNPHAAISRCTSDKVVKCLRCPATYHTTNYCVPAGTLILSTSQIVCPRHLGQTVIKKGKVVKFARTINTPWCFICSKGGDLICCETCPTSVHSDCMQINLLEDGAFICEDCETGRFPLYDEIVWVKLGAYRWWPAVILFPNEIPDNVKNISHNKGEFVVKFFGTHDHYWVHRGRVFLFQEGDRGHCSPTRKRVDALFKKSIEEAAAAHHFKKVFKMNKEAEIRTGMKPPPYIRVKVNKPVGNVRLFDGNISNTTSCECDPKQANPCGPDSDCLNRLLLTECDPNICPAKEKCHNQLFEKRQYPPMLPFKTPARGWGLKTLAPIRKGDFVIEYVGEIIDEQEYQRRIHKMHEQKDENYYFLTIDKDRIIDAGPKGNLARFMNHCCQPNCETQKWTVNGDTRVGLFAMEDITIDAELTFNYNLECIGKEKKICKCGAPNCSGFIGVKAKSDESQKKPKKNNNNSKKKKQPSSPQVSKNDGPCFICGQQGDVGACYNKICTKFYHLQCVNLEFWPEGKWVCPWHNCDLCSKRTIRCCVKCIHSYCPVHSEGNVRYDKLLGFICSEHDPTKEISNENLTTLKSSTPSAVSITEESDVTSTTPDEIDSNPTKEINNKNIDDDDDDDDILAANSSEIILGESVTSTPIKNKNIASFVHMLEDCENCVVTIMPKDRIVDIPEKQPDEKKSAVPTTGKRKRGRPTKQSAGNSPKKIKLSSHVSNEVKLKHNFPTSNLLDIPAQNEVKLSSSIPTRHLRTTRSGVAHTEIKRFLNRQSELEKDLPIRKRSRPRCEASL